MSKYELSLAGNYVPDWTIVDAVREFFQNALDQAAVNADNDWSYTFDHTTGTLQIANKKSVLSANTLLLGCTSKSKDPNTIGQFGEGYKVATLVALRVGKTVTFYNYGKKEIWRPRMVKSRKYEGAEILTFFTEKFIWKQPPDDDLTIVIGNITAEDWEAITESNLHCQDDLGEVLNTSTGRILLDPKYKGKIFVNGLFVCDYDYQYGYDFLPQYIKMDRDRKLVSDFDLRWLASRMWASTNSTKIVNLARLGANDVAMLEYQAFTDLAPINVAYNEFRETYGEKAVPVTNQQQMENYKQKSPQAESIIVSDSYNHLIRSSQDYQEPIEQEKELPAIERLKQWFESVQDVLTQEQQDQFNHIINAL